MVIGMLTIVAMLGTVLLIVARQDASQSVSVVDKSQTDPVVASVISRIVAEAAADRFCKDKGPNGTDTREGPYSDIDFASLGAEGWTRYIDYPDSNNDAKIDRWLTSVQGTTIRPSFLLDPNKSPGSAPDVCTDGDGVNDAWLTDMGITDRAGNKFFAAVKVVDANSRINVNTAGHFFYNPPGAMAPDYNFTLPPLPDRVNLDAFLNEALGSPAGSTAYGNLHAIRAAGVSLPAPAMSTYSLRTGLRPMNPPAGVTPALPFAVSDEPWLLYTTPAMVSSTVDQGRLYNTVGLEDLTPAMRQMLTTLNASMQGLRPTYDMEIATDTGRMNFYRLDQASSSIAESSFSVGLRNPTDPATRNLLYKRLCRLLDPNVGNPAARKTAAHLVANLWTYCEPSTDFQRAYYFRPVKPGNTPEPEEFAVYGMIEQLVFSEVVVWQRQETSHEWEDDTTDPPSTVIEPNKDGGWFYAIEIYNPTGTAIKVCDDTTDPGNPTPIFIVKTASGGIFNWEDSTGTLITSVGPGERIVLYRYGGYGDYENAGKRLHPTDPQPDMSEPEHVPVVTPLDDDFFFGAGVNMGDKPLLILWDDLNSGFEEITLLRKVEENSVTHEIVLDKISVADIGWTPPASPGDGGDPLGEEKGAGAERDDDATRQRAMVAKYKTWESNLFEPDISDQHTLTEANSVGGGDLADVRQGFGLTLARRPVLSVGEFADLWLTGPGMDDPDGTATPFLHITKELADNAAFHTPSRTRVDFTADIIAAGGVYPELPWACLLGELFECVPGDPFRHTAYGRVYGRININTASKEVLRHLPWPATIHVGAAAVEFNDGSANGNTNVDELIDYLIKYRDGDSSGSSSGMLVARNFSTDLRAGLRSAGLDRGFLTSGELALVLADYYNHKFAGWADCAAVPTAGTNAAVDSPAYLDNRNALYNAVANLVSVNSDVFQATVLVRLMEVNKTTGAVTSNVLREWRYVTLIDRGNCITPADRPVVLMMTEVK